MKMVAAAKLRKSRERIMQMRPLHEDDCCWHRTFHPDRILKVGTARCAKQERVAVVVITSIADFADRLIRL